MATTVPPHDLQPGDLIERHGKLITVRKVSHGRRSPTGVRLYRIFAEPDGQLAFTVYTGAQVTLIDDPSIQD